MFKLYLTILTSVGYTVTSCSLGVQLSVLSQGHEMLRRLNSTRSDNLRDEWLNYSRAVTCVTTLKQLRAVSLAAVGFYPYWRRVQCRQCSITCWSKCLGSCACGRSHGRYFSCCILFAASTVIRCCWEWWFTIVHTVVTTPLSSVFRPRKMAHRRWASMWWR